MENVRNRIKVEFIKKDDTDRIIKRQSKLTFNGIHKSYENKINIRSNRMKCLWISLFIQVLVYWN